MPTLSPTDITNIIIAAFPFLALFAGIIYRYTGQRVPSNVVASLTQFATIAVQMIEQIESNASPAQKKAQAVQEVEALFKAAHLPVPPEEVISAAIESAVYLLNLNKPLAPAIASRETISTSAIPRSPGTDVPPYMHS